MMKTGIELITIERKEQIEKHGRTVERDVKENKAGQLAQAAIALICNHGTGDISQLPLHWSDEICRNMMKKPYVERLEIVGAFCAAEIDRVNEVKRIEAQG